MTQMRTPRSRRRAAPALLAALALTGCGTSGYGTVDTHQLVLIPSAPPASAAARRAQDALVCGARAEARRLHRALQVTRPRAASASAQITVADAVTADKPGGVLIVPAARNAMLAPILSMRRAGIKVARLRPPGRSGVAAAAGARAVARVVGAIDGHALDEGAGSGVTLLASCASVE